MSTRSHIEVRQGKKKNYIYHHCDGYPAGVGMELKETLEAKHFFDKEKKFGIRKTTNTICNIDSQYEPDEGFHGDEEYYYVVDCDNRTLTCYEVPWDMESFDEIFDKKNIVEIKPD